MPPYSICRLCRNRTVDVCIEECAPEGDCRHFEIKDGVNLRDLPRFPLNEFLKQLPPKVRQVVVAVYLAKLVDEAQGIESFERPIAYRPRHRQLLGLTQAIALLADPEEEKPAPSPNGAKDSQNGK